MWIVGANNNSTTPVIVSFTDKSRNIRFSERNQINLFVRCMAIHLEIFIVVSMAKSQEHLYGAVASKILKILFNFDEIP